jgi:hypothetical protein
MPSGKEIKSTQRKERRVLVEIDASAGQLVLGSQHATLTVNGVGDFSLALAEPYARAMVGLVHAAEADCAGHVEAETVSGCDVKVTDLAGVAADKDVLVELVGWDAVDEI